MSEPNDRRHATLPFAQRSTETVPADRSPTPPAQHRPDLQLVERLIDGCEAAWQELLARYAGLVQARVTCVASTTGFGPDRSMVDDLVAEVFAALLNNDSAALRAYAGRSSLSTYLCVIASRVAIRKSVGAAPKRSFGLLSECVDESSSNPLDVACDDEQHQLLNHLVEQLPERQRALVISVHFQGKSYEQISRELGIPMGSIGPTLKRAQDRLRGEFEKAQSAREK